MDLLISDWGGISVLLIPPKEHFIPANMLQPLFKGGSIALPLGSIYSTLSL